MNSSPPAGPVSEPVQRLWRQAGLERRQPERFEFPPDLYPAEHGIYYVSAGGYGAHTGAYLLEMNLPVTLTSGDDYHQAVAGQRPVDALAVDDTLIESDPPDALRGQAGDDRVYLWHDRTTAYGGAGRDRLHGGAGADVMIGGAGSDVAHYDDATKGAVLDLLDASMNAGAALGDVLTGVENVHGTDLADTISGDGEDNMLFDRGADVISDFDVASDILAFHGVSVTDVSRIGADTIVRYDSGGTVTLEAVLSVQSDLAMIFALSDLAA